MIAAAAILLLGAAQAAADVPVPPPVQQAAPAPLMLPAGTALRLTTVDEISSRSVRQGQRFALRVANDVLVGSRIVIPSGTAAVGEVEALSGKGMFGKAARLSLQPLFVDLAGERVNLLGTSETRGHGATTAAAIATVFSPLGLLITGKSVVVPAGTVLYARVRSDVVVAQ
jgi:hypothetical protein